MPQGPTILVTGFDVFNGLRVNTSQAVAENLSRHSFSSMTLHTDVLPTSFNRATAPVAALLDELRPDGVVMLGLLVGISAFKVETTALNVDHAYTHDNDNYRPENRKIILSGPAELRSSWPANQIARRLRENGIPAFVSNDAGTYVCNHVFYTALQHIAESKAKTMCGFIHLPCLPEEASRLGDPSASISLDLLMKGVGLVLLTLAEALDAMRTGGQGEPI